MKLIAVYISLLLLAACSTSQIIRDSEYKNSETAFRNGDPANALNEFPIKEQGGFVTSIEKSWLGFWDNQVNQQDLQRQTKTLDSRQYISLSRETEYFFMNESEEGYIPSEHEIILMHILSSMYYMRVGQWEEARVETKQATYFLQSIFSADQKHFDDPALRIWVAALWTALGEWNEAQVDLRRAYEMSQNKNLLPLIEAQRPPPDLSIAFDGTGPDVTWTFGSPLPNFADKDPQPAFNITYSTLPWFQRHQERNTLIRDKISKSNYMSQYYGIQLSKGSERTVGFISANALRVTGAVVGTAIAAAGVYLITAGGGASASGSGDAVALILGAGFYVGASIWHVGDDVDKKFKKSSEEIDRKGQEDIKTYRYVRFLPSWISLTDGIVVTAMGKEVALKSPTSTTTVRFVQRY